MATEAGRLRGRTMLAASFGVAVLLASCRGTPQAAQSPSPSPSPSPAFTADPAIIAKCNKDEKRLNGIYSKGVLGVLDKYISGTVTTEDFLAAEREMRRLIKDLKAYQVGEHFATIKAKFLKAFELMRKSFERDASSEGGSSLLQQGLNLAGKHLPKIPDAASACLEEAQTPP